MKFFAVHTEDLESEQFIAATNDQIATWVLIHKVCSNQCNGGVISDAEAISERYWQRHGIDINILKSPSPLWEWEGGNLTLNFYDIDGEVIYLKKVEGGRKGGRNRKKGSVESSEESPPDRSPPRSPNTPNITHITQPNIDPPEIPTVVPPDGFSLVDEIPNPPAEKLNANRTEKKPEKSDDLLGKIWKSAPKVARERSSRVDLQKAWKSVPLDKRPSAEEILKSLEAWGTCVDWKKEGGQYIPGIHKWVAAQKWESTPDPRPALNLGGRRAIPLESRIVPDIGGRKPAAVMDLNDAPPWDGKDENLEF